MAIEKISENKRKQIINKSVNPLPNNPSKAGYKADEIKKAMFNFVTDEKDSVVDEINRVVDETNASFDDINNTNQETSKTIESINKTIKQINDTVSNKVDKEEGKHLSSNDFSSEEKEKLAKLNNYDDSEVRAGIDEINSKISAQASSTNQLADKDFVNSSIETATATFKGTFEDLDLLKETPADNNDYAFYDHISNSNRVFDRYKFNGTEWVYEFTLNNSSFTDAQWKAINSGATAELINKILTNADNINTILNSLNNIDTRLNNTVDKSSAQDISGLKNFTKRPTVNNKEVALKTDIAESSGTTVFVKGDPVTEFNADDKLDATANAVSATQATKDGDGNIIAHTYPTILGVDSESSDITLETKSGIVTSKLTVPYARIASMSTQAVKDYNGDQIDQTYLKRTQNAVSATKATQDGDGNVISTSYIKSSTKYNRTGVNALTALATWANNTNIPTLNTIAYWDGRYQTTNNSSNLNYCKNGTIVGTNGEQTISGQKTFNNEVIVSQTNGWRGFKIQDTDYKRGNTPTSELGLGRWIVCDKDGQYLAYLQTTVNASGEVETTWITRQATTAGGGAYKSAQIQLIASLTDAWVRVSGRIIPNGNALYDLGSSSNCWRDIFVASDIFLKSDSDKTLTFQKADGTALGKIRVSGTNMVLNSGMFYLGNNNNTDRIKVDTTSSVLAVHPETDGKYSLGKSGGCWKNLYLSGNVSDGTNTTTVKKLATLGKYTSDPTGAIASGVSSSSFKSVDLSSFNTAFNGTDLFLVFGYIYATCSDSYGRIRMYTDVEKGVEESNAFTMSYGRQDNDEIGGHFCFVCKKTFAYKTFNLDNCEINLNGFVKLQV